jgi:hypothetical protein
MTTSMVIKTLTILILLNTCKIYTHDAADDAIILSMVLNEFNCDETTKPKPHKIPIQNITDPIYTNYIIQYNNKNPFYTHNLPVINYSMDLLDKYNSSKLLSQHRVHRKYITIKPSIINYSLIVLLSLNNLIAFFHKQLELLIKKLLLFDLNDKIIALIILPAIIFIYNCLIQVIFKLLFSSYISMKIYFYKRSPIINIYNIITPLICVFYSKIIASNQINILMIAFINLVGILSLNTPNLGTILYLKTYQKNISMNEAFNFAYKYHTAFSLSRLDKAIQENNKLIKENFIAIGLDQKQKDFIDFLIKNKI